MAEIDESQAAAALRRVQSFLGARQSVDTIQDNELASVWGGDDDEWITLTEDDLDLVAALADSMRAERSVWKERCLRAERTFGRLAQALAAHQSNVLEMIRTAFSDPRRLATHTHAASCWDRYTPCGEHHVHDYNCGGGRLRSSCPDYWERLFVPDVP